MTGEPIVSVQGLTYRYPDAVSPALSEVSFEIEEGEFCLLAGLSGHGKSTLLRALSSLVPHFHGGTFSGVVSIAGLDTREYGPAQMGALVGVLFQDPETQLVMNSVKAELELTLESRGQSPSAVARGVEEVALALGIDHILDRSIMQLSGGEKQRVALAAALAGRPKLVLLDEPTSQLDPVAGEELISLLRRLNQEWEVTIVLAEHRLERCLAVANRVIALRHGALAHDGDPGSFLRWACAEAPDLQTPGARMFTLAGLDQAPIGVKQARSALRREGLLGTPPAVERDAQASDFPRRAPRWRRHPSATSVLRIRNVWHELDHGPAILRGVDLAVEPGESIALMGRNGAGKSTLLRHACGLMQPTRGRIDRSGPVTLLLQNPGDYFLHHRVDLEIAEEAIDRAGLQGLEGRDPRDLSGGERQRLAIAIVTAGEREPVVLALDEPTRGMDRATKASLAGELRSRAAAGQAVIVATHDPEFAAACADRAVLLADGRVIADGDIHELLCGGWYFATETSRILGGEGRALLPEQGAALLRSRRAAEVLL